MKRKLKYDDLITIMFMILLAITYGWDAIARDGIKCPRILLIVLTLIFARIVFKNTFLRKSRAAYVVTMAFIFASMYLANVFDFYGFLHYDKILHLASGVILAVFGFIIYIYLGNNQIHKEMRPAAMIFFSLVFTIAAAGVWEIWEFSTDQIFGLTAQMNSLHDTMWDIICGTIGGLIMNIPIAMYSKGKQIRLLSKIVEEMTSEE